MKAKKCGLSVSEYVKQRALGFEPRAVPTAIFQLIEKIGNLSDLTSSKKVKRRNRKLAERDNANFA